MPISTLAISILAIFISVYIAWEQNSTSARIAAFEGSHSYVPVCLEWARYVDDRRITLRAEGLDDTEIDDRIERLGQVMYTRLSHSINQTDHDRYDIEDHFTKERYLRPASISAICGTPQEFRIASETNEELRVGRYLDPPTERSPLHRSGIPSPVPTESLWFYRKDPAGAPTE